ncbi:MAG: tetratricopeptide repeat protein [Pseudomonadota bacterium]
MARESGASRPADSISSDLGALREMEDAQSQLGWSWQFALIIVLVAAFVALAWFGRTQSQATFPVVFNAGVSAGAPAAPAWMAPALEQALSATLHAGEQLRLVERSTSGSSFSQFGRAGAGSVPGAARWQVRAIITTSAASSQTATVDLELKELYGDGLFTTRITGASSAISDLALRSAEQLYAWLDVGAATREQLDLARGEIPDTAASEAFGEGVAALQSGRGREALAHFQLADRLAPDNAAIIDGLADTWSLLGYASNAVRESGRAFRAAAPLSRQRQLELEAQLAQRSEDWPRAEQVFSALKEFHPNKLDYHLALAESLASQDNGEGFEAQISAARRLPAPAGDDPRIDLSEAWYWYNVGDYRRCLDLTVDARDKATAQTNDHALAEALVASGRCDDNYDPKALLEAREIFQRLDIQSREPEILRQLASHEYAQANMQGYLNYLEQSVALSKAMGNEPQLAASNNSLAVAYDLHGWLGRGLALKQQTAAYQLERGNKKRYAISLENIGVSLFKLGRYEQALQVIDQSETVFAEVDDRIGIAWLPYRRGQIALRQGQRDLARELMEQAKANAEERPEGNLALEASYELAMNDFFGGDLGAAHNAMSAIAKTFSDLGLSASVAEAEVVLARIAAQRGQAEQARAHLEAASTALDEGAAYFALSIAIENANFDLLSNASARTAACRHLEALSDGQEHGVYRLRALARIAICRAEQDVQEALARLDEVRDQATALGLFEVILTEAVARAAVLEASGDSGDSRELLASVAHRSAQADWGARPLPDQYRRLAN